MTHVDSQIVSLDRLDRSQLASVLFDVVRDAPAAMSIFEPNAGESVAAAVAAQLSGASALTRQVFAEALSDVLLALISTPTEGEAATAPLIAALGLGEVVLALRVPIFETGLFASIGKLALDGEPAVAEAAQTLLSYVPSDEALAILTTCFQRRPDDARLAALLIESRSEYDPLAAFEFPLAGLSAADFREDPGLSLAAQAAVRAMFSEDGRAARARLEPLLRSCPSTLALLVREVLAAPPLETSTWARELLRREGATTGGGSTDHHPIGVSKRVLERPNNIQCLSGYTLSAAASATKFEPYRAPWMDAFALAAVDILMEHHPECSPKGAYFEPWDEHPFWSHIYNRLLVHGADDTPRLDLCFEMYYVNPDRHANFEIVEFGHLQSFAVVYAEENEIVSGLFEMKTTRGGAGPVLDFGSTEWQDVGAFLQAVENAKSTRRQTIHTLYDHAAGDLISKHVSDRKWDWKRFLYKNDAEELLEVFKTEPGRQIVICDNVQANDILARANRLSLTKGHIRYPVPLPIGVAYDRNDRIWGDHLSEAFSRVLANPTPEVRSSLVGLVDRLMAMAARPTPRLLRAVGYTSADPTELENAESFDE